MVLQDAHPLLAVTRAFLSSHINEHVILLIRSLFFAFSFWSSELQFIVVSPINALLLPFQ